MTRQPESPTCTCGEPIRALILSGNFIPVSAPTVGNKVTDLEKALEDTIRLLQSSQARHSTTLEYIQTAIAGLDSARKELLGVRDALRRSMR